MVSKFSLLHHIFGRSPLILGMCNWAYSLHGKPCFLFTDVLKRYSFQKNCTGIWSFLYYRERSCFFFSENIILHLRRKMKDDLSQKNTWKYDIFFKLSEKMVFPKRAAPAHDLSCIIWKDGIFFPKTWYFFPGQKVRGGLSQEIHGNMTFLCTRTGVTNVAPRPSVKKIKDGLIPQKYT